jgi:1-acyl-sn-glycerol-3-phosphate acyltransferase
MIPIARDMLRQVDAIPSDYSSIKRALAHKSIAIGLGGVDEMSKVNGKNLEFIIRKRKGIFKIALETGSPIVPVISYGENEIFPETENTFLRALNSNLYQLFRCKLPFPSFRSAYNWSRIMREPLEPIHTYTGKPVHVKKIDEPTEKDIKELRDIYIAALEDLFKETNKGDYTLKIT